MQKHLLSIFEANLAVMPDHPLYVHIGKDGSVAETVTYRQMARSIRSVSALLEARSVRGEKVALLYASSFEFIPAFLGCLHLGAFPFAYQVPNSNFKFGKMRRILRQSGVRHILVSRNVMDKGWFQKLLASQEDMSAFDWILDDRPEVSEEGPAFVPAVEDHEPMYFQLSSGSTGDQKLIPVSAAGVYHNAHSVGQRIIRQPGDRILSWLPHYHDFGLVAGLFYPLVYGSTGYLMGSLDFVGNPALWIEAISRYGIQFSPTPNFALELCAKRVDVNKFPEGTTLSSLRGFFVGAEPIRESTLNQFSAKFSTIGFTPDRLLVGYGMAESTLIISVKGPGSPVRTCQPVAGGRSYVTCGPPIEGLDVWIQREEGNEGPIGEVVVSGASVSPMFKDGVLHTGDLGFMDGGELFITGRKGELVILNGVKYMLHELEQLAEELPFVNPQGALACMDDTGGKEGLVMLIELKRQFVANPDLDGYSQLLNHTFNRELGISLRDIQFYPPASLPKTSSGKKYRGGWRRLWEDRIIESKPLHHGS
jgi:acyl-CoA synthetase (AMP-forming)/AMP-acid ligase II